MARKKTTRKKAPKNKSSEKTSRRKSKDNMCARQSRAWSTPGHKKSRSFICRYDEGLVDGGQFAPKK
jgi:hypothetical protein